MRHKCVMSKHHRKPKSLNGDSSSANISIVPEELHNAWHILFYNDSPEVIAARINNIWLDPEYEFVVQKKNH